MEGRNTDAVELNIVWMWTGAPGCVSPAQRGWWMLAGAGLMSRKPAVTNSPPVEYAEFCFIRCGRSGVQLTDFPPSRPQMQIQHRQLFSECGELKRGYKQPWKGCAKNLQG